MATTAPNFDFQKLLQINWILPVATAIGTLGGFQSAPIWFTKLSEQRLWQVLMAFVLVYQGGGGTDVLVSIVCAIIFYLVIEISKVVDYIYFQDEM